MNKIMVIWRYGAWGFKKKLPDLFAYSQIPTWCYQHGFPIDWKEVMINTMLEHNENKVALGLRIDDLP